MSCRALARRAFVRIVPFKFALIAVLSLAVSACASAPRVTAEATTFAPALDVDLSGMRRLPSGVYTRDIVVGEGITVTRDDEVLLHFVGWLADGTQFDAKVPPQPPMRVQLGKNQMINGWERGIPGMRTGGQRMLVVPPSMGYGSTERPNIPANSVLVFIVELVPRIR